MKQYIDKDTLAAEIEKRMQHHIDLTWTDSGYRDALFDVLAFIRTLAVKEVDLNKEISQFIDANFEKATIGHKLSLKRTAKHFFELGLKAQKGE